MPFLFRIVLCVVFVPVGWSWIMGEETYGVSDIPALEALEVLPQADEAAARTDLTQRRLYREAIIFAGHDLPEPVLLAWGTALLSLVGGGLLLLGLFTRLWGLGLAAFMGLLLATRSFDALASTAVFDANPVLLLGTGGELALGMLGLSLLITGGGYLSLDHAIFAHHPPAEHDLNDNVEA
jgi:uncharacterized membrane protein YphA (DoxX/SURF4 family)